MSESAEYECAFFSEKLGMLFNIHDSKVTVIGLDSHQYKYPQPSNDKQPNRSSNNNKKTTEAIQINEVDHDRRGVISLSPSVANDASLEIVVDLTENNVGDRGLQESNISDTSNNNHKIISDVEEDLNEIVSELAIKDTTDLPDPAFELLLAGDPSTEPITATLSAKADMNNSTSTSAGNQHENTAASATGTPRGHVGYALSDHVSVSFAFLQF